MSSPETGRPAKAAPDRLFWVRGTIATVAWLLCMFGTLMIPKWLHLFREIGVTDFPIALSVLGALHTGGSHIPVIGVMSAVVLTGAVVFAWLRAHSRARFILAWVFTAPVILIALLNLLGLGSLGLTLASTVNQVSGTP